MSIRKQTPELKDRLKDRQDNKSKYQVTPEMQKKGSLKGKTAIRIPELKMTIYTSHPEREAELRDKYLNKPLFIEPEIKTALKEAI